MVVMLVAGAKRHLGSERCFQLGGYEWLHNHRQALWFEFQNVNYRLGYLKALCIFETEHG